MNVTTTFDAVSGPLGQLRGMFYALPPHDIIFQDAKDVPNIKIMRVPIILVMAVVEAVVAWIQGQGHNWRPHIALINYTSGAISLIAGNVIFRGVELSLYQWLSDNYCIYKLPWDSLITYVVAAAAMDFAYYWWHRGGHEINLMWASHHIHHSSEDMNLSVDQRLSILLKSFKWMFFAPLACLGLPPASILMHAQLGGLFAYWTHSGVVPKLGKVLGPVGDIIEFIFVTPNHHRVHHACNRYCLDKNYGRVLIVWDRLFGTYAEEREDEELVFGSLHQPATDHIMGVQVHPFVELYEKFSSMDNFGDKMRALFYGPGWFPGTPRLGNPEDVPDVRGRAKHNVALPHWMYLYLFFHTLVLYWSCISLVPRDKDLNEIEKHILPAYIFLQAMSLGGLYDGHRYAAFLEPLRLTVFFVILQFFPLHATDEQATLAAFINGISLLLTPLTSNFTLRRKTSAEKLD